MAKFRGLVYVKHGRVGSRSEGPDYYLQTYRGDLLLRMNDRHPWKPDYELEFYGRTMVEIEGTRTGRTTIQVQSIAPILAPRIPHPEHNAPGLGEPVELRLGECVLLDDAPLKVTFLSVEDDSRCPSGVTCVWEGQCVIVLGLTPDDGDDQRVELTVRSGHPELAEAVVAGYHVEVHAVKPYPSAGTPTEPSAYRARIEVNRIE